MKPPTTDHEPVLILASATGPTGQRRPKQPGELELTASGIAIEAEAPAAEGQKAKARKFSMVAYTGGAMTVGAFSYPIVIDLSGLDVGNSARPILIDHINDIEWLLGQTDKVEVRDSQLLVEGSVFGESERARQVIALNDRGFKFQASVGARVTNREFVPAGSKVNVNGRTFDGPINVARKAVLGEVSFVILGADDNTSARIAAGKAEKGIAMNFEQWLEAKGIAAAELTDAVRNVLKAQFDAEQKAEKDKAAGNGSGGAGANGNGANAENTGALKAKETGANVTAAGNGNGSGGAGTVTVEVDVQASIAEARKAIAAENKRIAAIRKACGGKHADIEAKAIEEGWDETKTELEVLRAARPQAPAGIVRDAAVTGEVLEAAVCLASGVSELPVVQGREVKQVPADKVLGEKNLEAAYKHFRTGMGLQQLLYVAARANGYTGDAFSIAGNLRDVLGHAFVRASGFSTFSLPGILSNTANKFLLMGFTSVEDSWRQISATRPVKDFKTVTSYRLTGSMEYEEVGPDGELKSAEVGEESFTNQAKTYGRLFAVTRQDIINDDLGALTAVPRRIGRGAALKLNNVFWTAFMDNASFFAAGNNNYFEGAATALGVDSLTTAEKMFFDQTDPDGQPLGISPAVLLTPNGLSVTAATLMNSTEIRNTTANTTFGTANPHAGKFKPVRSSYLSNTAYTGNSATGWYLLASPDDLAVIEVAFLNGREQPTVETADADFNVLGIQMRGYHDFGCSKQDYRGGVKSKGAA